MKKIVAGILIMTMALSMSACGAKQEEAAAASSAKSEVAESAEASGDLTTVVGGELHMATNAAFPPYEMTDDAGGYEGIDVEIATAIAEKLGLELVVDDMDFASVIAAVQSGKADIAMAGLTVNEERKQNIDFTDSYATGVQVIIVPEGSAIASVDDLSSEIKIGCQEATTGYIYCSDDYGEEAVVSYTNGATAIQSLLAGKVDCVVIDSEPAKQFVAANEGLQILDTEYVTEEYAIGISKENNALLDAVNAALQELIADGTVDAVIAKYINAE